MKLRLAKPDGASSTSPASPSCAASTRRATRLVIGAMTTHDEVANSAVVRGAIAGSVRRGRPPSAIRMCATAAPSAARSPTTIPPPTIPAAVLALGATDRHQQARDQGRRLLQGPVHDRAAATARSSRASPSPFRQVRLRQVRQPGLALCAGRRGRGADRQRRARRRDGGRQQRRVPPAGHGGGARQELVGASAGRRSPPMPPT